jgi:DNA adenine methylase
MQYMGGKAMIARRVVQAILDDTPHPKNWFEPFVGGGNVLEYAAPHFTRSVAMDAHPDLILMWQAVASGHRPPKFVSREQYRELRHAESSAIRGFAGFGASFGGKWFGGYGVSPRDGEVCRASYRSVTRQGAVFQDRGVVFRHGLFGSLTPPPGTVVYCDPPYAGTTGYSTGDFDHGLFYKTLAQWAQDGCAVYVSEYTAPEDVPYTAIWSREKRNVLEAGDNQRTVTEKLFRIGAPS